MESETVDEKVSPLADSTRARSSKLHCLAAVTVGGIIAVYATQTTAELSITGRPVFDMVALLGLANLFWYLLVRTFPGWSKGTQFGLIAAAIILQATLFAALRMDGVYGNGRPKFTARWNSKSADRSFANVDHQSFDYNEDANAIGAQFRGPGRSSCFDSIQLRDFSKHPPRRVWTTQVGSGWSAFAIADTVCITQEQRGEFESVVCYELATGKQLWIHQDPVRFAEPTSGEGPRATPTIDRDRVFTLGATGILNCLQITTGEKIWSRNVLLENDIANRPFGMTGSPLVHQDRVIVAPGASGADTDTAMICYKRSDGEAIWSAGNETASYSSPQFAEVCGQPAVLCLNGDGLSCHRISDGRAMFHVAWTSNAVEKNNVCQPVIVSKDADENTRILISSGYGRGAAVFEVRSDADQYVVDEVWRNKFLKSKFASAVTKDQFVYGLDNGILTCLALEDGQRMWKQGRYGHGQLIRVGDHLLVLAEKGFLAQVECKTDQFAETSRLDALSDRTWNHPAFDGRYLIVRNDQEAICFELPLSDFLGEQTDD